MFIEIKKLSKIYGEYLAVDKINFNVEKNKTVGLLGPNGCGKTTTIGMILGLVSPTAGEILIEDKNINNFKRDEILKRFNFASPYVELPKKLTVKQNLEIYGRLYGISNLDERINEISEDLDIVKLFTFESHFDVIEIPDFSLIGMHPKKLTTVYATISPT